MSRLIIEAKEKNFTRLSAQLGDPKRDPKTSWSVLNHFLHNKKIPRISPILVNGMVFFISLKKLRSFIHILLFSVPRLLTTANFLPWSLKLTNAQKI